MEPDPSTLTSESPKRDTQTRAEQCVGVNEKWADAGNMIKYEYICFQFRRLLLSLKKKQQKQKNVDSALLCNGSHAAVLNQWF